MFSPARYTRGAGASPSCAENVPRRWMKVKILYTFDLGKTNCLVRLQEPVNVPTFALSTTNIIGMIELNQVVRAVMDASPEAKGKLGMDYTVYTTDHSEDQSPHVGHGRLSNLLMSKSGTVVTGRVSRNILGMFSKDGINETLEVNLRLVPFSTFDEGLDHSWLFSSHNLPEAHGQHVQHSDNPSHIHGNLQPPQSDQNHSTHNNLQSQLNTDPVQDPTQDPTLVDIPSSPPVFLHERTPAPSSPGDRLSPKRPRLSQVQTDSGYTSDIWNTDNIPPTDFLPTDLPSDTTFAAPRPFRRPHTFALPPRTPTLDELKNNWNKTKDPLESQEPQQPASLQRSHSLGAFTSRQQAPSKAPKAIAKKQKSQQHEPAQPLPTIETSHLPPQPVLPESNTAPPVAPPQLNVKVPASRPGSRRTSRAPSRHTPQPASGSGSPVDDHPNFEANETFDSRRRSMTAMSPEATALELTRSTSFTKWEPKQGEMIYEPGATGIPQPRSGSGAKRRRAIEETLKSCIDNGEMPPFCNNCGEIRTPTWRKVFAKEMNGDPDEVSLTEAEQKDLMSKQVTAREGDKAVKFRLLKRALNPVDQQEQTYQPVNLCNRCGLYFHKKGTMPVVNTDKANKPPTTRQRRPKQQDPYSDLPAFYTDPVGPEHQAPTPSMFTDPIQPSHDQSNSQGQRSLPTSFQGMVHVAEPKNRGTKRRPSSAVDGDSTSSKRRRESSGSAQPSSQTHLQSAPTANQQKQLPTLNEEAPTDHVFIKEEHQEIRTVAIDLTSPPRPTSRLLFPSPRKDGEFKSLDSSVATSPTPTRHSGGPMFNVRPDTPEKQHEQPESNQTLERTPLVAKSLNQPSRELPKTPKSVNKNAHRTPARAAAPPETPFTARAEAMMYSLFEGSPGEFPTFDTPPKGTGDTPMRQFLHEDVDQENNMDTQESSTLSIHVESEEYIVDAFGEVYDGSPPIQTKLLPGERTPKVLKGLWGTRGEWTTYNARKKREQEERMQR